MKSILLIGAGRSATSLINYLAFYANEGLWTVTVADSNLQVAESKISGKNGLSAVEFSIENSELASELISKHDAVISMLPATMHPMVAKHCLSHKKHLFTASYVSPAMLAFHEEAKEAGLIFLNECGLDPGIDHLSAMQVIDEIHDKGGKILGFKSYCGGLVAPEFDNNPWGYKFTWNPKNVVLAGQGTASFLEGGSVRYLPYSKVFSRIQNIEIPHHGKYDGYANRDSVAYKEIYRIPEVQSLLRGTLRKEGYCAAWNVFVQLGMTDDNLIIKHASTLTLPQLLDRFLPAGSGTLAERLQKYLGTAYSAASATALSWLGAFTGTDTIGVDTISAADALLIFLQRKWVLEPHDKDMIVMQHQFDYEMADGKTGTKYSSLVVKGIDQTHTAMAQTVGLPLGIACRLVMENKVQDAGVVIPVTAQWYNPILHELAKHGIVFHETEK